jgi:hypothetical protein
MALNKAQKEIAKSDARFRVFVAGRRCGKTFFAIREMARFARFPNKNIWYIAPTYAQAKNIVWEELCGRMKELGWAKKINQNELSIRLVNNSKISLKGSDRFDTLRGSGVDFLVLDEYADMRREAWEVVLRPTLSAQNPPGSALFCGTPRGFNHFKDLYDYGQRDDKDWESFQFTTLDGGQVSEEEVERAKEDMDQRQFQQEYLAAFQNFSGVIYYNFDREKHMKKKEFDENGRIYIGMDFNIDPMSASICQIKDGVLHQFDEISMYGSNTEELCQEIMNRYNQAMITIYPDPAGRQRKTSANGRTDVTILQKYFNVEVKRKHDAVRDRINAVNSLMESADGTIRFSIDPKCTNSMRCLERQIYKSGTAIPDKDGGFDHQNDALGYLVSHLSPIKKEVRESARPSRFTHM